MHGQQNIYIYIKLPVLFFQYSGFISNSTNILFNKQSINLPAVFTHTDTSPRDKRYVKLE